METSRCGGTAKATEKNKRTRWTACDGTNGRKNARRNTRTVRAQVQIKKNAQVEKVQYNNNNKRLRRGRINHRFSIKIKLRPTHAHALRVHCVCDCETVAGVSRVRQRRTEIRPNPVRATRDVNERCAREEYAYTCIYYNTTATRAYEIIV